MKKIFIITLIFSSVILFSAENYKQKKFEIKKIVLFKNGLGFFVRESQLLKNEKAIQVDGISNAVLGTVWFSLNGKNDLIKSVRACWIDFIKSDTSANVAELISSNKGKYVKVVYSDNKEYEGEITNILYTKNSKRTNAYPQIATNRNLNMVLLKSKSSTTALYLNRITSVEFKDGKVSTKFKRSTREKVLQLDLKNSSSNKIYMTTLQKQIGWTPSYVIDISRRNEANLLFKAVITNDIYDLKNVDVDLVIGYPNFKYKNFESPMSLNQNAASFFSTANVNVGSNKMSFMNQAVINDSEILKEGMYNVPLSDTKGSTNEDLYLYNIKKISMKPSDSIAVNIFSKKISYQHLYKWEIPETTTVNSSGYYLNNNKIKEQVWHIIKLDNSTNIPWTTGPILVVNKNKPVSQDVLNYTPVTSKSEVKITISPDVKTDRKEEEIGRDRKVKIKGSYYYDLVTIKGELFIKNTKRDKIHLEIKKKIIGEVIKNDNNSTVVKEVEGLKSINYKSIIKWDMNIKSGETKKLSYQYSIYIRS